MGHVPVVMSRKEHTWVDNPYNYLPFSNQHRAWHCTKCGMRVAESIYGDLYIIHNGEAYQTFGIPPCAEQLSLGVTDVPAQEPGK